MDRGKQICSTLKELRRRIAEANGIQFESVECTHQGPCQGTCPMCEQEVSDLEAALREKERRGETVLLHGIVDEQELQDAFKSNWQEASQNTDTDHRPEEQLAGIPALPKGELAREFLFGHMITAVADCIKLSKDYPDVALYLDPFDHITLISREPCKEADALFGFDYCDWQQFVRDNEPCPQLIRAYVDHRIAAAGDDYEVALDGMAPEPRENHVTKGEVSVTDNQKLTDLLFDQLSAEHNGTNLIFSPLGVASILEMLQCGTDRNSPVSETIHAMLDGFKAEDVEHISSDDTRLEHATGMWCDHELGILRKSFVDALRSRFDTHPQNVDFRHEVSAESKINSWVDRNTHGLIPQLDLQLAPDTLIVLADALYLKATWELPFDAANTRKQTFQNADGTVSRVDMMCLKSDAIDYEAADEYQVVGLRYTDELFMTIVLPRRGHNLIDIMKAGDWLNMCSCNNGPVELRLPKFRFDTAIELRNTLSALGLADLFDKDDVLTAMTDTPAHISRICQQCSVGVDERGTEAAAAAFAECQDGCPLPKDEPKPVRMTVDRPFGFAIKNYDEVVLFMGVVNHLGDAKTGRRKELAAAQPARDGRFLESITVAGTTHIKNIDELAERILAGTELSLRHETGNRYDRNAIGLYLGDDRVGFVPRQNNQILANLLDAGLSLFAVVTEASWRGNWFNIRADILLATE